ncbi:DUF2196 domain-containing protein [Lysinibacillus xylanilyticus]|uniref:DUF2196 domain-containing protein n=1 Tax=Lysinibacillus xylanilyticus TaxID=582475 RepID=UPI0009E394A4
MYGQYREDILPGKAVDIVKKDRKRKDYQRYHLTCFYQIGHPFPHGIKVRLTDGQIERVQEIQSK